MLPVAKQRGTGLAVRALIAGVLLALLVPAPGGGAPGRARRPGRLITQGSRPFTESWQQMVRRSAARRAALQRRPDLAPPPLAMPRLGRRGRAGRAAAGHGIPDLFSPPKAAAPQQLGGQFRGLDATDTSAIMGTPNGFLFPPDTMGAVGYEHFVEHVNGGIAVFSKAGTRLGTADPFTFFSMTVDGVFHPDGIAGDPRIVFDRGSGHWFTCVLEFNPSALGHNNILLAVTRTFEPTGLWDKYLIPVALPDVGPDQFFNDFDTLGVDRNGVYFGTSIFSSADGFNDPVDSLIAATGKESLLLIPPFLGPTFAFLDNHEMWSSPQPAVSFDLTGDADPAWFVAAVNGPVDFNFSGIALRSITWNAGVPSLSDPFTVPSPVYQGPPTAPAMGSATPLDTGDDRMQMAILRDGMLWSAHNVGVNAAGDGSTADRTGCEWFQLDLTGAEPGLVQLGRVWDPAPANPVFYFYPSISVSGQGHAAMGFSGSNALQFPAAYTCGRLATDPLATMGAVMPLKTGEGAYERVGGGVNRWGDYSYTSVDPADDMTLWTIQEYSRSPNTTGGVWGTWVSKLIAPAPQLNDPAGQGFAGQPGVVLMLTGNAFFDPGDRFPQRLRVYVRGGSPNGVGVILPVFNSPNSVTATFDLDAAASPGPRDVVLVNPDGQAASVPGGFEVLPAPPGQLEAPDKVRFGKGGIGNTRTQKMVLRNRSRKFSLLVTIPTPTSPFGLTDGGGTHLIAPFGQHVVTLTFTPASVGPAFQNLFVTSSDPARPRTRIILQGAGKAPH